MHPTLLFYSVLISPGIVLPLSGLNLSYVNKHNYQIDLFIIIKHVLEFMKKVNELDNQADVMCTSQTPFVKQLCAPS